MPSRTARGPQGRHEFVVVANRLPVDHVTDSDGSTRWARSPGGLVTALEPVMKRTSGAWVGWSGTAADAPADEHEDEPGPGTEPFDADGMTLVPVTLSAEEVSRYYEGFSNGTLWPLYHDVIAAPAYHREWWDAYVEVNDRFAEAAAEQAAPNARVWVHDYQLQLAPAMLRERRPDLRIGFFNHIPFPPYEIFAQLPWRRQVLDGLLGADVLGFQRDQDANNFLRAVRRAVGLPSRAQTLRVPTPDGERVVHARSYPISIDSSGLETLARTPKVQERVREIREELGSPRHVVLGVDRLDYTKGIGHRLKAFGELLDDGKVDPADTVLVQVATPSRERVDQYKVLRDEIELAVGRINGAHGTLGRAAVLYLHHSYPRSEMAALYQVADVMVVTSLRDGMNLVAKEYIACRTEGTGVLVLSEFTGAAVELGQALLVNPHDIEGLKSAMLTALSLDPSEQARRMRFLRRRVREYDVNRWADGFLDALENVRR